MLWGDRGMDRHGGDLAALARAIGAATDLRRAGEVIRRHLAGSLGADGVALILAGPERGRAVLHDLTGNQSALASGAVPAGRCVALRLGRPYSNGNSSQGLLRCELCGSAGATSVCAPMTACGTVVGSLLATGSRVKSDGIVRLDMAAAIAGPAIAGLRSFELASILAHTDPLTSLPNRRAAEDAAEQLVALARRGAGSLTALRIDVDGLATLNDRLGTETGDGVVAGIGALLRARLRTSDVVARIGGDEFLAILPDTPVETAVELAQALRTLAGEMTPPSSPDPVTVSVGVAAFPTDGEDAFALLAAAERALLSAKSAGGNRVFAVEPPDPWALLDDAL